MKTLRSFTAMITITLVICITIFGALILVDFSGGVSQFSSLEEMGTMSRELTKNEGRFFANKDESLLKKTGFMGTILHKTVDDMIYKRDLFTLSMENEKLSTEALTFDSLDYSMVKDEITSFGAILYDNQQLQNYCETICYLNYRKKNRVKMEIEIKKQYVEGSKGLAPYFGMWDIICDYNFVPLKVGSDKHRIDRVQTVYAKTDNCIDVSVVETSNTNPIVTITETYSFTQKFSAGVEIDEDGVTGKIGADVTFTYGKSTVHTFEEGSVKLDRTDSYYLDVFGNRLKGKTYTVAPNSGDSLRFGTVQRIAYHDNDNMPDDIFAFAGISAIQVTGIAMAPNYTIGDFNNPSDAVFGVIGSWKVDNKLHSYMANVNGMSLPVEGAESYSNLNKDIWDHTYSYGE